MPNLSHQWVAVVLTVNEIDVVSGFVVVVVTVFEVVVVLWVDLVVVVVVVDVDVAVAQDVSKSTVATRKLKLSRKNDL